jgi:hypothetical protein
VQISEHAAPGKSPKKISAADCEAMQSMNLIFGLLFFRPALLSRRVSRVSRVAVMLRLVSDTVAPLQIASHKPLGTAPTLMAIIKGSPIKALVNGKNVIRTRFFPGLSGAIEQPLPGF